MTRICAEITNNHAVCHFNDPKPDEENVPVKLDNAKALKPFEVLTTLFANPKYNEIDPTFLLAPVFMLFFGIMLTDAVYGVMMAAVGLLLLRGGGKYSDSVKDFGVIFTAIGSATVVFGILTGGYLGDFAKAYLGINALSPIIFDPMVDVQLFLGLVLIIGLIHLNLGLILGIKANLQQKEYQRLVSLGCLNHERIILLILVPFGLNPMPFLPIKILKEREMMEHLLSI